MKNHEITPEQSKALIHQDFLLIPNAIPIRLLSQWRGLLNELNENVVKAYSTSSQTPNASFTVGPIQTNNNVQEGKPFWRILKHMYKQKNNKSAATSVKREEKLLRI